MDGLLGEEPDGTVEAYYSCPSYGFTIWTCWFFETRLLRRESLLATTSLIDIK
jgi:hypothetical protein